MDGLELVLVLSGCAGCVLGGGVGGVEFLVEVEVAWFWVHKEMCYIIQYYVVLSDLPGPYCAHPAQADLPIIERRKQVDLAMEPLLGILCSGEVVDLLYDLPQQVPL